MLLSRMSDPWLKRMDRLQGRSEADVPTKKDERAVQAPTPPKRKFDMEEEWKVRGPHRVRGAPCLAPLAEDGAAARPRLVGAQASGRYAQI